MPQTILVGKVPSMRHTLRLSSLLGLAGLGFGCGGDGGEVTAPTTGSLEITTTTSGSLPPTGYTYILDGGAEQAIGPNATITVADLEAGPHIVQLAQLPPLCTVRGGSSQTVNIAAGSTAQITFAVTCVQLVGSFQLIVATTGPGPSGYELVLDGTTIGSTSSTSFGSIPADTHTVGLTNVPANCQPAGVNPQSITIPAGDIMDVSFAVTCTPPPAQSGTLVITTTT